MSTINKEIKIDENGVWSYHSYCHICGYDSGICNINSNILIPYHNNTAIIDYINRIKFTCQECQCKYFNYNW